MTDGLVTIIAGNRDFHSIDTVRMAVATCPWKISEVVSGGATGVDALAILIARDRGLPLWVMPADWKRLGRAAGPARNAQMADVAQGLILVHNGRGPGSKSMLAIAKARGLRIHEWKLA